MEALRRSIEELGAKKRKSKESRDGTEHASVTCGSYALTVYAAHILGVYSQLLKLGQSDEMIVKAYLKERISEFEFRTWDVSVTCGRGLQPLRWLGHAAVARMAYDTGDVPSKYLPQAVRSFDGKEVYHPDKRIVDVLKDGALVEIECSRGPEAFTANWEGKPPPVIKDFFPKVERNEPEPVPAAAEPQPVPAAPGVPAAEPPPADQLPEPSPPPTPDDGSEWGSHVVSSIDWTKYDFGDDLNKDYDTWEKSTGVLQSLLLWYCSKGHEIEDKDFGLLNFEQFRLIFVDCKLCSDEELVRRCFDEGLQVKSVPGTYQLSILQFIPALVRFVSSSFYNERVPDRDRSHPSTKVKHLIDNYIAPSLNTQLAPELQDVHAAAKRGTVCNDVLNENQDSILACLKVCRPKSDTSRRICVEFQRLLPYLRKWLVLGEHWNATRASLLTIYAYQTSQDALEFKPTPLSFDFGKRHLKRFLFGASYYAFMESTSLIKISDHAYLRDFLEKIFNRAGVAKPLYITYEEKKAYLRAKLLNS